MITMIIMLVLKEFHKTRYYTTGYNFRNGGIGRNRKHFAKLLRGLIMRLLVIGTKGSYLRRET